MRSLVDRASQTSSPCFAVAELNAISSAGFDLLRSNKVLVKTGVAEEIDHPSFGRVAVRKTKGGLHLVDLSDPARDWIKIEAAEVERFRFSHQGMIKWIARLCGTEREVSMDGPVWTVGTTSISGRLLRLLYYHGPVSTEKLLAAIRTLDLDGAGNQHLLLLPFTMAIAATELLRLERQGLFLEYLYQITTEEGLNLELVRLPAAMLDRKPGYYFRKVKGGNSWEVGFNTAEQRAVPHSVAMERLWLLLRNPDKEYTASLMTDELNGRSNDRKRNGQPDGSNSALVRSKGTRGRTTNDLTEDQKHEGKEIHAEMMAAKDQYGEESREFRDAEEAWQEFCNQFGLAGIHGGKVKREGNDESKEAETLKRSIDRWIDANLGGDLDALARHLDSYITRGTNFAYNPPEPLPWQT
jgi:hypothetical protein